jgi:hypothetical protein
MDEHNTARLCDAEEEPENASKILLVRVPIRQRKKKAEGVETDE